jgi:molybdenum cofactor cytidylyltransferase
MSRRRTRLAVLLAAGAGTRFVGPGHKLLAEVRGRPVVSHALEAMVESDVGDCIVVHGAIDLSSVVDEPMLVHNPDWVSGQRSSVEIALRFAADHGYDCVVIGLGDQPFVSADAWRSVAEADGDIVVATYDGVRGNPVKLDKSVWELFRVTDGDADAGARTLMHLHPELVREVACKGISADIDTPEDLAQWT